MARPHTPHGARCGAAGFTLIELMIVVAVISVLAALAMPSYLDSVRKGRRSEAVAALAQVQQAQERWRANRTAYSADLTSAAPNGLALAATTPGGLYAIGIDAADNSGYTVTAAAAAGTSQSQDTNCSTMRVRMAGGNIQYGGCGGCAVPVGALSDPNRCWAR